MNNSRRLTKRPVTEHRHARRRKRKCAVFVWRTLGVSASFPEEVRCLKPIRTKEPGPPTEAGALGLLNAGRDYIPLPRLAGGTIPFMRR